MFLRLFAVPLITAVAGGCGRGPESAPPAVPQQAAADQPIQETPVAGAPRSGEPAPDPQEREPMPEIPAELVDGNNRFALDLYARLRGEGSHNLFFSPYSLSSALAMTYAGARGETAREMAGALHFALPQDALHPAFADLGAALRGAAGADLRLIVANRLWGHEDFTFRPEFLHATREFHQAELQEVDFAGRTEEARGEINAWVAAATEGRIEDLIPPGALDAMTRLVLTNAIYFKGSWTSPFDGEATEDASFFVAEDETVTVPMMHQKERFRYGTSDGVQVLELPYGEDQDLSMIVLLPEERGGLPELEEKLTAENLARWTERLGFPEVDVFLPRFRLTEQFELRAALESLGMTTAFVPGEADFTGMSDSRELFLSAVLHKAFVEVNEEGTEAAAATGVVVGITALIEPAVFRADHPFVFLIRENGTGSILFLGRVIHPAETD